MSVDTQTAPLPIAATGHKRRNSGDVLLEKKLRADIRRNSEEIDELKLKEMLHKKGSSGASDTWWLIGAFVTFNHIVGIYAMFFYTVPKSIYIAVAIVSFFTAFGITGGYHRLWSHRAYDASLPLRIIYAILGTNAFQGSIKWWVLRHRLHHRYTDTDHDPYNSKRGFYFSHIGWMFEKPYYPRLKSVDASDLNADPVVRFQHKYIALCLFVMGFVCPALLGKYLANDWLGGLLWIGFVGRLYVWHITWSINSFAHWMGDRIFCDSISARGNLICAFLTNGEGYHNFHHEFPRDYRNGVHWYDYDPTKWFIRLFYWTGLASNLHRASNNAILQSRVQVQENELARARAKLEWGPEDKELPEMTLQEFQDRVKTENLEWIIIRGFAINISDFKEDHPGGAKVLQSMRGKDATAAFEGGMNNHSNSAKNLAALYRVARIVERDPSEPKYLEDK